MSSTVYNPFLYGWMNDNFQKEFRILLPCLFTVFSHAGSGKRQQGIEIASPRTDGATVAGLQTTATPRTEAIRLQRLTD